MAFFLYNRYDGTFKNATIGTDRHPVVSEPASGQYRVKKLRLDADKKVVLTYDNIAES